MLWKEFPLLSFTNPPKSPSSISRRAKAIESSPKTPQINGVFLVHDLIIAYKTDSNSEEAIQLQEQFNQLSGHNILENIIDFDKTDLDAKEVRTPSSKYHMSNKLLIGNQFYKKYIHINVHRIIKIDFINKKVIDRNKRIQQNKTLNPRV